MTERMVGEPPRWLLAVPILGGLLACGVYLGMMRVGGMSAGNVARVAGFGVLGFLML